MEQKDSTKQVEDISTELMEVVNEYLELFFTHQFKHHLAPNAILNWFGVTVRGSDRIHDFLKYKFGSKIEHKNFNSPKTCEFIEAVEKLEQRTEYELSNLNSSAELTTLEYYAISDSEHSEDETKISVVASRKHRRSMCARNFLRDSFRNSCENKEDKQNNSPISISDDELESLHYGPVKSFDVTGLLQNKSNTLGVDARIRISYCLNETNQSWVFCFIVYEAPGKPQDRVKRNLMLEFEKCDATATATATATTVRPTMDSSTFLTETTNDLVSTLDTSVFSNATLRTSTKESSRPTASPKRKPRFHDRPLKRHQGTETSPASRRKRKAVRRLDF